MGSLLILVDANARSQSVQIAVSNISFAIDAMTRQMRTGTAYGCHSNRGTMTDGASPGVLETMVRDCINGGRAVSFTDTRTGWRYGYAQNGNSLQRKVDRNGVFGDWEDMTAANIRVTDVEFTVLGAGNGTGNNDQPTVTIYLEAEVGDIAGLGTTFEIQTSITQRALDL
jgi:hypothetical protein